MATKRDEYIAKLKTQLDQWNGEMAKWESQAAEAQAGMRAEYEKQLAAIHRHQDQAREQLRKVQAARATRGPTFSARRRGLGGDAQGLREGEHAVQAGKQVTRGRGARPLALEHPVEVLDVVDEDPLGGPAFSIRFCQASSRPCSAADRCCRS